MAFELANMPNLASAASSTLGDVSLSHRKLRLLVAAAGPRDTSWAQTLVVRLSKNSQIEMRAIVDDVVPRLAQTTIVMQNFSLSLGKAGLSNEAEFYRQQAYELVEWADLLVCVPLDVDGIAKMLNGVADTFLSEVLRGWDAQKTVVLVPGMSIHMWASHLTKRQLSKLHRKWRWVRVISPILWHYEGSPNPKRVPSWSGFNEVLSIIQYRVDLLGLGREVEITKNITSIHHMDVDVSSKLPPEIWTTILEHVGDWELAKALRVYTTLPLPSFWSLQPRNPTDPLKVFEHELEWTTLTCNSTAICKKLSQSPPNLQDLPALVVKLIIRFALVEVLTYMEANRPDLFKAFDGTTLSTKASAYYPHISILEYWKSSKFFRDRHIYDSETMDGASKNGHVHILDWWWRRSGLPLRYTEAALEQASAKGHLLALDWWRDAAAQDEGIVLRPGRSLLWAAQYGQADVLRWWDASGIPVANGDGVANMASRWGHVNVLETWRKLKGDANILFDGDVLVTSTLHQHIEVLDWWRRFAHGELHGMEGRNQVVNFRRQAIEEALRDSSADHSRARQWWLCNRLEIVAADDDEDSIANRCL